MEGRAKKMRAFVQNEKGAVTIVEAAIVFPIMFFVLLFIIFIGNLYYEQARIDSIVLCNAVKGAQYMADPLLYNMDKGEAIPANVGDIKVEPYRFIIGSLANGSISRIEKKLSKSVTDEISNGSLLFSKHKLNIVGTDNKDGKIARFNNYVVYSTFVVQINYEVKLPIQFLGEKGPTIARLSSRAEVSVNDSPEFIRNVDMVVDLLEGSDTANTVKGIFQKINGFIAKFSQ